jgi:hypothetical protein
MDRETGAWTITSNAPAVSGGDRVGPVVELGVSLDSGAGSGRRQLVRFLSGEIGVEHRILGFPDRRIGELDRKARVGLGVVCAPAGPVDVDLRLLGLNLLLELGDVLVPVPLDVVPPEEILSRPASAASVSCSACCFATSRDQLAVLLELGLRLIVARPWRSALLPRPDPRACVGRLIVASCASFGGSYLRTGATTELPK